MKINKNLLVGIATVSLFTAGSAVALQNNSVQTIEAKILSKKLVRNANIYNNKGKRVTKTTLKKGSSVKVYSYKKINGKKFARIAKNKYVKSSNLTSSKTKRVNSIKKNTNTDLQLTQYKKEFKKANAMVAVRDTQEEAHIANGVAAPKTMVSIKAGTIVPLKHGDIELVDGNQDTIDGESFSFSIKKESGKYILKYNSEKTGWFNFNLADFKFEKVSHVMKYKTPFEK